MIRAARELIRLSRRFGAPASQSQQPDIDFNSLSWSDAQKVVFSQLAQKVQSAPSFINEEITLFGPPPDSLPFTATTPNGTNLAGFAQYPAAGAGNLVILSYTAPQGKVAVINRLAITHVGGNPPDGTGNVIWQVLVNSAAVKGMNNMLSQFGTLAAPKNCQIVIMENDVIQVVVQVPAGKVSPNATTAASFDGFTVPSTEALHAGGHA